MKADDLKAVFAQRLRVAMAAAGMNRSSVARALGVTPSCVQSWTRGRTMPNSATLLELCRVLGTTTEFLMEPRPVDVRSATEAPDGKHIKEWIRETLAEMAAEQGGER